MPKPKSIEQPQSGKMTALRLDPKLRYLADIGARVTGESLTKFLEGALAERLKKISLYVPSEPERIFDSAKGKWTLTEVDAEEERIAAESLTIANKADLLWSENEYERLLMLSMIAPRLVDQPDKDLLNYIDDRKDLQITVGNGYKMDRKRIVAEWDAIKADFAKVKGKRK